MKFLAIDKDTGNYHAVSDLNFQEEKVEVTDSKGNTKEFDMSDVVLAKVLLEDETGNIVEGDIFKIPSNGVSYVIFGNHNNNVLAVRIDMNTFEEISIPIVVNIDELQDFLDGKEFAGNVNQIQIQKILEELASKVDFNFNVMIVKDEHLNYYYALNDKDNEIVDVIPVLFIGANLIKEESYFREEYTYDDFEEAFKDKEFVEVSPQELQNYALGKVYGKQEYHANPSDSIEEEEEEHNEINLGDMNLNMVTAQEAGNIAKLIAKEIINNKHKF